MQTTISVTAFVILIKYKFAYVMEKLNLHKFFLQIQVRCCLLPSSNFDPLPNVFFFFIIAFGTAPRTRERSVGIAASVAHAGLE
jgi:hypothetical protein